MDNILKDLHDYQKIVLIIFFAPLILYFYEFATFSMTYDELRLSHSVTDLNWLRQGRWGMYYLSVIYAKNPVFPVVGLYISAVLSGLTVLLIAIKLNRHYYKDDKISVLLFCLIFLSYPSLYFLYSFSTISYAIGPIYILSLFSAMLLVGNNLRNYVLSVPITILSLSLYQASITLVLSMYFILLYGSFCKVRFREFIFAFSSLLVSIGLYYITIKVFLYVNSLESTNYVSSFTRFSFDFFYLSSLVKLFFIGVYKYFSFSDEIFLSRNSAIVALSLLGFLLSCQDIIKSENKIVKATCVLGLVFSPFLLNILSTDQVPTRTLIALPLVVAFWIYLCLETIIGKGTFRNLFVIFLTCAAIVANFIALSKLMFVNANSWENDKGYAQLMVQNVYQLPGYSDAIEHGGIVKTHLVGYRDFGGNQYHQKSENIGKSFFSWGANEITNISTLFNTLGFEEFEFAELSDVRPYLSQIRNMPNWPHLGSIRFYERQLVIKVSDYSEAQLELLCRGDDGKLLELKSCSVSYNPQSIQFLIADEKLDMYRHTLFDSNIDEYSSLLNVIVHDGQLLPQNSDSQIILPAIDSSSSNVLLEVSGNYSYDDFVDLYFLPEGYENYTYYNVIRLRVPKGELSLSIILPAKLFLHKIRIDPSSGVNPVKGFSVKVLSND
ncbi:glucosyltransferase domain-containing protein [Vibrio diazotrophicus]|uniref:glucosyltransferase domain-containing protein n=1 Tax=Vibrio diazotrophicus TaxID=685 RepID=UPI000C9DFCDD|nr:glucosyltransferase domain-containing protein [Vibrio diazotrophicus]PNH97367.1 hypothetical protein C1O24_06455 [Vibrio diazotrophicus]